MIIPLGDNIIIESEDKEKKTKSGILISQNSSEPQRTGKVIAVGEGKMENGVISKSNLKKGDIVVLPIYGPQKIKIENKEYIIIPASDILAVIK